MDNVSKKKTECHVTPISLKKNWGQIQNQHPWHLVPCKEVQHFAKWLALGSKDHSNHNI